MRKPFAWRSRGVSLGRLNFLMAGAAVLISALLLIVVYQTSAGYESMRVSTDEYVDLRTAAYDMQVASDYLTEQVRCFSVTADRNYLDNYFREANVTQRREHALETLKNAVGESAAYLQLELAMDESTRLMDREYYSMRLTIEAYGYDLSRFPQVIRDVELTANDAALSGIKKEALGRSMVFDFAYRRQKQVISKAMQLCLSELNDAMDIRQDRAGDRFRVILQREQRLIVALIVITLAIVLLTSLLVILPLRRAVSQIQDDQLIPANGAYEFRFLAETYNIMYEVNRKSKETLAYEASHDKLTGLYNRGGYDFLMSNVDFADTALLLVDVDFFKEINDSYGHEVGDRELAWIASVIRAAFRSLDYVCRIGGDEFAVIMLHVSPENADLIRGKVRRINRILANPEAGLPATSISVGVAFGDVDAGAESVYRDADAALYKVKQRGRGDCAFYANLN